MNLSLAMTALLIAFAAVLLAIILVAIWPDDGPARNDATYRPGRADRKQPRR